MAAYLLDTSFIIDALNRKRGRNEFLLNLVEREGHVLACCPINVAEVYAGMRPREAEKTTAPLRSLSLFPVIFAAAEFAGRLKRDHVAKGVAPSVRGPGEAAKEEVASSAAQERRGARTMAAVVYTADGLGGAG
jgi:predicted nucleic acid-binding protein